MNKLPPSVAARYSLGLLFFVGSWLLWGGAYIVGLFFVIFSFFLIYITND